MKKQFQDYVVNYEQVFNNSYIQVCERIIEYILSKAAELKTKKGVDPNMMSQRNIKIEFEDINKNRSRQSGGIINSSKIMDSPKFDKMQALEN